MLNVILKVLLIAFLALILMTIIYFIVGNMEWKRDLNFLMYEMAVEAGDDLATNIPRSKDVNRVLIVPDVGVTDEGFRLTEVLAEKIESAQKFDVITWEEAKSRGGDDFKAQFGAPPGDINTASRAAIWLNRNKSTDIQAVFRLVLERFTDGGAGGAAGLHMRAELVQIATGDIIGQPYQYKREPGTLLVAAANMRKIPFLLRVLLWAIVAGAIPFIAWGSGLAPAILRQRKNAHNLALLIGMTVIAMIAAWMLLGFVSWNLFIWITFFAMIGVAAFWNFDALEFFSKVA